MTEYVVSNTPAWVWHVLNSNSLNRLSMISMNRDGSHILTVKPIFTLFRDCCCCCCAYAVIAFHHYFIYWIFFVYHYYHCISYQYQSISSEILAQRNHIANTTRNNTQSTWHNTCASHSWRTNVNYRVAFTWTLTIIVNIVAFIESFGMILHVQEPYHQCHTNSSNSKITRTITMIEHDNPEQSSSCHENGIIAPSYQAQNSVIDFLKSLIRRGPDE